MVKSAVGIDREAFGCCGWLSGAADRPDPLEAVFFLAGFRFARQEGSHRAYVKNGVLRPVVIPTYDEVPVALIRNNLKTAGLGRDEYFELLGRI